MRCFLWPQKWKFFIQEVIFVFKMSFFIRKVIFTEKSHFPREKSLFCTTKWQKGHWNVFFFSILPTKSFIPLKIQIFALKFQLFPTKRQKMRIKQTTALYSVPHCDYGNRLDGLSIAKNDILSWVFYDVIFTSHFYLSYNCYSLQLNLPNGKKREQIQSEICTICANCKQWLYQ